MGPRAGLEWRKISFPTGIRSRTVQPGSSVAIPTELPGPQLACNISDNELGLDIVSPEYCPKILPGSHAMVTLVPVSVKSQQKW